MGEAGAVGQRARTIDDEELARAKRDLEERNRQEDELKRSRVLELRQARVKLREKIELSNPYAAAISHRNIQNSRLNNPR